MRRKDEAAFPAKENDVESSEEFNTNNLCRTKYPIMLIHGIGYSDSGHSDYWGRIPETLRTHGAKIYFGDQDGFGGVRENAAQVRRSMLIALDDSGAEKLNLIAHSKGGLEARYLISKLDMAAKTATLTTLATPHRGLKSIDVLKEKAKPLYRNLIDIFSVMIAIDGGEKFGDRDLYEQLSADYAQVFNELVCDSPEVYYQSYAFDMVGKETDPSLALFHEITEEIEGPNDGLVSVESARWGNFRGVLRGFDGQGISHSQVVDGGAEKPKGERGKYILDFYITMVRELKERGF